MCRSITVIALLLAAGLTAPLAAQQGGGNQQGASIVDCPPGGCWSSSAGRPDDPMFITLPDGRAIKTTMGFAANNESKLEDLISRIQAGGGQAGRARADGAQSCGGAGGMAKVAPAWSARGDEMPAGDIFGIHFDTAGAGTSHSLSLRVGAILYRAKDSVSGPFRASATFTQTKVACSKNGYGLFYGGKDLDGALSYTYFYIRGDGSYQLKRLDSNGNTTDLVSWTPHAAIKSVNPQDPAVNVVEIDAKTDPKKIAFIVNGQTVHSMDVAPADVKGIVGLRAGPFLDLDIARFAVKR